MDIDYNLSNFVFGIFSALGSVATFGAFVFLFRRDKDKQDQIDKLTGIVRVLETQNDLMKLHNELIAQQVDIFRNTSVLNIGDNIAFAELKEIEEKKLKLVVRPNLWLNGAGYNVNTGELKIDLNNKGEDAVLMEFVNHSNDIILHNEHLPYDLDKGGSRYIFAKRSINKNMKDINYEIEVIYKDKLDNRFMIKIQGTGANVNIIERKEI